MKKSTLAALLMAAVGGVVPVMGQARSATPAVPERKVMAHSDTTFARELLRLNQPELIKAGGATSKGTGAEGMWKAQAQVATWDEIVKNRGELPKATQEYLASVKGYLGSSAGAGVDGNWGLDHAKFIFGRLSEPVISRLEYFANVAKDREQLAPMAALADQLLKAADAGLTGEMEYLGSNAARAKYGANEDAYTAAYTRAYGATVEVKYYNAWAKYFLAMAMAPGGEKMAERKRLLTEAIGLLEEFAEQEDMGVMYQSKLLRGKAYSELNDTGKAIDNFKAAQQQNSPGWVAYQAKYQTVVAYINARDFAGAGKAFGAFKEGLAKGSVEAQLSADMLGYRLAWAEADAMKEGAEKETARLEALKIMSGIIARDVRFRDLVYEQLAAQVPENADLAKLMPMQQAAVAYSKSQGQKGDTAESKKSLKEAIAAATAVRSNKAATKSEQVEAVYLLGVCHAVLEDREESAKFSLEFAEQAPKDARAKEALELALNQIGQLRVIAEGNMSAELKALQERGLRLVTGSKGGEAERWTFAYAVSLEESGKLAEAEAMYKRVPPEDRNYVDSQFRLIRVTLQRYKQMTGTAKPEEIKGVASSLFRAIADYEELITKGRAGVTISAEARERGRGYFNDLWLIEVDVALSKAVDKPDQAAKRLDQLEKVRDKLPSATQGALLRYKIQMYQAKNEGDKAIAVIKEYARSQGQGAAVTIVSFIDSLITEINVVEKGDPKEAIKLAGQAVDLLSELIKSAESDPVLKPKIYDFRVLQADMMVRAHRTKEAIELSKKLQGERDGELINFMTEARAIYTEAFEQSDPKKLAEAQDYFGRLINKVPPGKEAFWECWLRIIQCKEKLAGAGATEEIKRRLTDLKAFYGDSVGGDKYKEDFAKLMQKYMVVAGG